MGYPCLLRLHRVARIYAAGKDNLQTLIYTVIIGVLALACSQLIKAVLGMAANTREILTELRKRNGS